jgi:hypothetical protein
LGEEGGRATGRPFKWAGLPWLISRGQRSNATLPLPSAQRAVPVLPDPDPSSLLRAKRAHTCQGSCPLPGRSWACSINWWLPWLACLLALLRTAYRSRTPRPLHILCVAQYIVITRSYCASLSELLHYFINIQSLCFW